MPTGMLLTFRITRAQPEVAYSFPRLQAHHLDLEFYDRFYKEGAYLKTHAAHQARWHPEGSD